MSTMELSKKGNNKDRLVIGVDFGTTFTGIAWAHSYRKNHRSTLTSWPISTSDDGRVSSDKVPTLLRYNKDEDEIEWGFAIPPTAPQTEVLEWFKLELDKKVREVSSTPVTRRSTRRCPGQDPVKITTDFLTAVAGHVRTCVREALGPQIFSTTPVELTITVPAIWSQLAKETTLKACEHAFANLCPSWGQLPIQLISEPEAAAIYTLEGIDKRAFDVDDTIIVMDAGGGTVDLVSYTITDLAPVLQVAEAAPGSGGKCGSSFLNKRFGALIEQKLKGAVGFDKDVAAEVMDEFEKNIKRRFTAKAEPEAICHIRVSGVATDMRRGISRGRLNITGAELHEVFRPVILDCLELLKGQIAASGKSIKAILLVGGFGASIYLKQRVRELVHSEVMVLQPTNAWQAIVQGAVMCGMSGRRGTVAVQSRRARMHFGMELWTPLEDSHPGELKALASWNSEDQGFLVPEMQWILQRGEVVREDVPYRMHFNISSPCSEGPLETHTVYIYHDMIDRAAQHIMDKDI